MNKFANKLFGSKSKKLGEESTSKKRTFSPTVEPVEKDIKVDGIRGMREEKKEKEEKTGEKGEHLSLGQEKIEDVWTLCR